jgi:predicted dithiol-disulfide oxidoreductase (DUF899 family)
VLLRQAGQVFETYWSSGRAAEVLAPTYALLDMAVYGHAAPAMQTRFLE